ncbi:MAG: GAF domain-containing protein [Lachnospiraceae bacterium]|nr:GAF domain-containing protein [Lachnospiraceae bacterium]
MNTDYTLLTKQMEALAETANDYVPLFSNVSALLFHNLERVNWAGFYLMKKGSLLLGPFQGKVACVRIAPGKGVCGSAVSEDRVLRVPDVHEFPGHIACDADSASEIVIPLHANGTVIGVLDIDSPEKDRFDEQDEEGLRAFAAALEIKTDFSALFPELSSETH